MRREMRWLRRGAGLVALLCFGTHAHAAVIFGNTGLNHGSRWDAAPRTVGGNERSLDGGLRYAMQGGGYAGYRNLFNWRDGTPSVSAFTQIVQNAFAAWTVFDPVTGLGTDLSFVHDPATAVQGVSSPSGTVNFNGAEIDLFGVTDGFLWDPGDAGQRGETFFDTTAFTSNLTLTSGTTGYTGFAIRGADIRMNANPQVQWDLDDFSVILTHEIGHALGLGDVDFSPGRFLDDNYDGTNATTARNTLTNPWAQLVDVDDPSNSPLAFYDVANGNPGVDTFGVDILMESNIPQTFFDNASAALQNDDFGGRQFLYPWVAVANALAGDFNGNGSVEQGDLDLVLNNWGGPRGSWSNAEGFASGPVDQEELDAVLNGWGASSLAGLVREAGAVPEPATMSGVTGLALLGLRGRRSGRGRRTGTSA